MPAWKERFLKAMQDPRFAAIMNDPRTQTLAVRALRLRGRVEGAIDRSIQRIANRLNLATQKDLRALHRRIRHLEQELREAQETQESLIEAEEADR